VAGLVSLAANGVALFVKVPGPVVGALTTSPMVASITAIAACVMILLSQVARATFDMASDDGRASTDEGDADQ
jgi:hypothetical protein